MAPGRRLKAQSGHAHQMRPLVAISADGIRTAKDFSVLQPQPHLVEQAIVAHAKPRRRRPVSAAARASKGDARARTRSTRRAAVTQTPQSAS